MHIHQQRRLKTKLIRLVAFLAVAILFIANSGQTYLAYAASSVDTSTTSSATNTPSLRKSFYDEIGGREWMFYNNGTYIEASYSTNSGNSWTSIGNTPIALSGTSPFGVAARVDSGTSYVYLAYTSDSYVMYRQGVVNGSSITWSDTSGYIFTHIPAWTGSVSLQALAFSESGYLWGGVRTYYSSYYSYLTYTSTIPCPLGAITFNNTGSIGPASDTNSYRKIALAPLGGNTMLAVLSHVNGMATSYVYDGSVWAEADSDYGYDSDSTAIGVGAAVQTSTFDNSGNLIVGGVFQTAGGQKAMRIAKWDGDEWSTIGSGFNSTVRTIVVDTNNDIYAGGDFTYICSPTAATCTGSGSISANGIAKWNGSSWSAMGTGMAGGTVYSIAIIGSNVYAGGSFSTAGGNTVNNIARWDGSAWYGLSGGVGGAVYTLAVSGSNLYAAGTFTNTCTNPTSCSYTYTGSSIGIWNGSTWSTLNKTNSDIAKLVFFGSTLYVTGSFSYICLTTNCSSQLAADNIAYYDTSWHAVSSDVFNGTIYDISIVSSSEIYAVGSFTSINGSSLRYAAKWDGTSWSKLTEVGTKGAAIYQNTLENVGNTIVRDATGKLYFGGGFDNAGGTNRLANYVATYYDGRWGMLGNAFNARLYSTKIASNGDIYVAGDFNTAPGQVPANNVASFNGTSWSAVGNGFNDSVYTIEFDNSGNLYAGGTFTAICGNSACTSGNTAAQDLAVWNGSSWSPLASQIASGTNNVNILKWSGSSLYVGGQFTTAGGVTLNNIGRYSGGTWYALGTGMTSSGAAVYSIEVNGSDVYAGGYFTAPTAYVAKWNGTSWSALGTGINGIVYSMDFSGTDLYVGGDFTTANGGSTTVNGIAKWNGTTWSALNYGVSVSTTTRGGVRSVIADSSGNVFLGGSFLYICTNTSCSTTTNPAYRFAKWDGTTLSTAGSGLGAAVSDNSMSIDSDDNIYIGGTFGTANSLPAYFYVKFTDGGLTNLDNSSEVSILSDNDYNAHLLITDISDHLVHVVFDSSAAKWSTQNVISTSACTSPTISYDNNNGNLYAFWLVGNSIYHKMAVSPYADSDWDTSATLDYSTGTNVNLTSTYHTNGGGIQYYWTRTVPSPITIMSGGIETDSNDWVWSGNGDGTSWSDPANWDHILYYPDEAKDRVVIDATNDNIVTPSASALSIGEVTLGSSFSGSLTLQNNFTAQSGTNDNTGSFSIASGVTLSLNSHNLTVQGTFNNEGTLDLEGGETLGFTFDSDSGTTLYSPASGTVQMANVSYYNLTVDAPGAVLTLPGSITVNNNFALSNGTFNQASGRDLTVRGNFTLGSSATYSSSATVLLQKTSGTAMVETNGQTLNNLTLGGGGNYQITDDLDVNGALTVNSGTLNTATDNTNLNIAGNVTVNGGTVNAGSGTTILDGDLTYTDTTNVANFKSIQIGTSPDTTELASNLLCTDLTVKAGDILNTNGYNVSCSGNVVIEGTGTLNATTAGGRNSTITIGGNWTNSGTFTPSTSTVVMNSITAGQTITGGNFNNLTLTNTNSSGTTFADGATVTGTLADSVAGSHITFHAGSTYNVANLALSGTSGSNILLRSSSSGSTWDFNVSQSNPTASYVDVRDSDATGGNAILANIGSTDSGNNSNWIFYADYTWTGSGDGTSWDDASNWTGGSGYPRYNTHTATLDNGAYNITTPATDLTVGEITFGTNYEGSLTLGANLTIDNDRGLSGNFTTINCFTYVNDNGHTLTVDGTDSRPYCHWGYTWTGAGDGTSWEDDDNWIGGPTHPEVSTDTALINTGMATIVTPSSTPLSIGAVTLGSNFFGRVEINSDFATTNSGNESGNLTIDGTFAIFDANGYNLTVTGQFTNKGYIYFNGGEQLNMIFDEDSGTAVYDPPSGANNPTAEVNFYNLTINDGVSTVTLASNTVVNNDFSVVSGAFDQPAGRTLTIGGDLTISAGATFSSAAAIVMNKVSGTSIIETNGSSLHHLTIDGGATYQLADDLDVNGALTVESGNLDMATNNVDVNIAGNVTIDSTITAGTGLTTLDGDLTYDDNTGVANFGRVQIGTSPDTTTLASNLLCSSLYIASGDVLITNGYDIADSGDLTIDGTLTATSGTGGTTQINVGGNWVNNGILTAGNSTVILDGAGSQSITAGGNTSSKAFYNLTLSSPSNTSFIDGANINGILSNTVPGTSITFAEGATYNVGDIDLQGASSQLITLVSDNPGNQWYLNVTAANPSASYVDVQDSNANGGNAILAQNGSVDSGNNNNWMFYADYTWTGSGDGTSWDDPSNWTGGNGYPRYATHTASLDSATYDIITPNTLLTVGEITFGSNYGGTFTLGANLTVSNSYGLSGNFTTTNCQTEIIESPYTITTSGTRTDAYCLITYTWTGAGDGTSWTDPANWGGGALGDYPRTGYDIAVISSGTYFIQTPSSAPLEIGELLLGPDFSGALTLYNHFSTTRAHNATGNITVSSCNSYILTNSFNLTAAGTLSQPSCKLATTGSTVIDTGTVLPETGSQFIEALKTMTIPTAAILLTGFIIFIVSYVRIERAKR